MSVLSQFLGVSSLKSARKLNLRRLFLTVLDIGNMEEGNNNDVDRLVSLRAQDTPQNVQRVQFDVSNLNLPVGFGATSVPEVSQEKRQIDSQDSLPTRICLMIV